MDMRQDTQWPVLSGWPQEEKPAAGKQYYLVIPLSEKQHRILKKIKRVRRFLIDFGEKHARLVTGTAVTALLLSTALAIGSWLTSPVDAGMYPEATESVYTRPADSESLDAERAAYEATLEVIR